MRRPSAARSVRYWANAVRPLLPPDVADKVATAEGRVEWSLAIARTAATVAERLQALREVEAAASEVAAATQ